MDQVREIRALDRIADMMTEAHELRAEIARLTRERDEAIAVAVWASKHNAGEHAGYLWWNGMRDDDPSVFCDGTDADIYRALKEARNGE